jgi:hypothetical protein
MTKPALNPVAPSRAHARNASSRSLLSKQPQNRPASATEQILAVVTSQHPMPSRLRRAQEKTPSRPGSTHSNPIATHRIRHATGFLQTTLSKLPRQSAQHSQLRARGSPDRVLTFMSGLPRSTLTSSSPSGRRRTPTTSFTGFTAMTYAPPLAGETHIQSPANRLSGT